MESGEILPFGSTLVPVPTFLAKTNEPSGRRYFPGAGESETDNLLRVGNALTMLPSAISFWTCSVEMVSVNSPRLYTSHSPPDTREYHWPVLTFCTAFRESRSPEERTVICVMEPGRSDWTAS